MKEIWKDVVGYEGLYQVSNLGKVKALNYRMKKGIEHELSYAINYKGYVTVSLCKNGFPIRHKVYRLVAKAFIPNPLNLPQVNHKDENKLNNKLDNLEWCTNKYNCNYGTKNAKVGERTKRLCSKRVYQYSLEGNFIKEWFSAKEAEQKGFNPSAIGACARKVKWHKSHQGYKWSYVKN